jgi:flavin reductase (DIM6/NTAB) family NADH-FMN oxidoreductase RutF
MPARSVIDSRALRQALGCFPTGVTIVTALAGNGAMVGLTVNSFNSLSLHPPLVLWSLATRSSSRLAFESAGHFAVNVLADDQVALSQRFSSQRPDKVDELVMHAGLGGAPLIEGCSAHIECSTQSSQVEGDHVLFIGRVERVRCSDRPPLVFVGGRYRGVGAELG